MRERGVGGGLFNITKLFLIYSANETSKRARWPLVNFKLCKMADRFRKIVTQLIMETYNRRIISLNIFIRRNENYFLFLTTHHVIASQNVANIFIWQRKREVAFRRLLIEDPWRHNNLWMIHYTYTLINSFTTSENTRPLLFLVVKIECWKLIVLKKSLIKFGYNYSLENLFLIEEIQSPNSFRLIFRASIEPNFDWYFVMYYLY